MHRFGIALFATSVLALAGCSGEDDADPGGGSGKGGRIGSGGNAGTGMSGSAGSGTGACLGFGGTGFGGSAVLARQELAEIVPGDRAGRPQGREAEA